MKANEYCRVKSFFSTCSVGMFGKGIYAFEQLTGPCDIPEYHQISKEEFEAVESWVRDNNKVMEILRRPVLCDRNKGGRWGFDEKEAENTAWGRCSASNSNI